jgi:hypothetical protein
LYQCRVNVQKGRAVCANDLKMRLDDADRAVLDVVQADILRPEVVEAAVQAAVQRLQTEDPAEGRRAQWEAELTRIGRELERFTAAIAADGGSALPTLVAAIRSREAEQARARAHLAEIDAVARVPRLDPDRLAADLRRRLTDWQGLLGAQPVQARQALRKLLAGRLVFTPMKDADGAVTGAIGPYYEFRGEGRLDALLIGVVLPATKPNAARRGHARFSSLTWAIPIFGVVRAA